MRIKLYPNFNEVFIDDTLKGIFYPLCSVVLDQYPENVFHFVSSNGLWINEGFETEYNTFHYTQFNLIENKYKFKGSKELYKGAEQAQNIFDRLEKDFEHNGKHYLKTKTSTDDYIENQKRNLNLKADDEFDADYYLQTFYEFSINKLNFELTNEFGAFKNVIEGWIKNDQISSIVYDISSNNSSFTDIEMNAVYLFPESINISDNEKIGQVIGCEFFTDGNDSNLLYNTNAGTILNINSYS